MLLYRFVKMLSIVVSILPDRIRHIISKVLGEICWLIVPVKRKIMAIENIMRGLALDKSQATQIAKRSTTRFGRMILEVLRMRTFNKNNIRSTIQIDGLEHLTEALSYGKGAILATSHSGNWELLGAALALEGFPLISVAQKQTNVQMDRFINEIRTLSGMKMIYKTGVRDMIKHLGEGYVVGILMDQDAHKDGVMVEFMGRLASTPQGAAALARLKDAPIVPAFVTENDDGTHRGIVHPLVWVEKTSNREQDILLTTQRLTTIVEGHIRQYPHEWFWLHNRWKSTPPTAEVK